MAVSRIEQLIEDIYEFIESCRMQPLSSTKVIVPKDELYDLIDELRLRTPDEIKKFQKIISNRDAIISDAQEKAAAMLANAREHTNALISEHEIMQQAYFQANEVVNEASIQANRIIEAANNDANEIRSGAIAYTDEMLYEIEKTLSDSYESTRSNYKSLMNSLTLNLNIVTKNRKELCPSPEIEDGLSNKEHSESAVTVNEDLQDEDDFDFDENTFLEEID